MARLTRVIFKSTRRLLGGSWKAPGRLLELHGHPTRKNRRTTTRNMSAAAHATAPTGAPEAVAPSAAAPSAAAAPTALPGAQAPAGASQGGTQGKTGGTQGGAKGGGNNVKGGGNNVKGGAGGAGGAAPSAKGSASTLGKRTCDESAVSSPPPAKQAKPASREETPYPLAKKQKDEEVSVLTLSCDFYDKSILEHAKETDGLMVIVTLGALILLLKEDRNDWGKAPAWRQLWEDYFVGGAPHTVPKMSHEWSTGEALSTIHIVNGKYLTIKDVTEKMLKYIIEKKGWVPKCVQPFVEYRVVAEKPKSKSKDEQQAIDKVWQRLQEVKSQSSVTDFHQWCVLIVSHIEPQRAKEFKTWLHDTFFLKVLKKPENTCAARNALSQYETALQEFHRIIKDMTEKAPWAKTVPAEKLEASEKEALQAAIDDASAVELLKKAAFRAMNEEGGFPKPHEVKLAEPPSLKFIDARGGRKTAVFLFPLDPSVYNPAGLLISLEGPLEARTTSTQLTGMMCLGWWKKLMEESDNDRLKEIKPRHETSNPELCPCYGNAVASGDKKTKSALQAFETKFIAEEARSEALRAMTTYARAAMEAGDEDELNTFTRFLHGTEDAEQAFDLQAEMELLSEDQMENLQERYGRYGFQELAIAQRNWSGTKRDERISALIAEIAIKLDAMERVVACKKR